MLNRDTSTRVYGGPGGGKLRVCAGVGVGLLAAPVMGQVDGSTDKSGYWLLRPTPRMLMREMSTDRPDTTESPHTVDAGHFQVELSFVDWTYDRRSTESVTTRSLAVAPLMIKVGVLNNVDVQVGLEPYTRTHIEDRSTGDAETIAGFGDTLVRVKVNLWGNDEADAELGGTSLAIMPFVSLPTATDGLGSGHTEWGVIVPLGVELGGGFDLGAMLEVDVTRSASDDRSVVDLVHTVTLGHELWGGLAGYVEYAGFANLNHDERYRGYFDTGVTYALGPGVRLDAGMRIGLTTAADDVGVFAGVSFRY